MKAWLSIVLVALLALAACAPAPAANSITVKEVWGRPSPAMAAAGAFYMVIRNTGQAADRLVSAQSDACGVIELHESYTKDGGVMGMRMVTGGAIEVPAGGTVELKPGGLHIMCLQKKAELKAGERHALNLKFEKAGAVKVEVEIRGQ